MGFVQGKQRHLTSVPGKTTTRLISQPPCPEHWAYLTFLARICSSVSQRQSRHKCNMGWPCGAALCLHDSSGSEGRRRSSSSTVLAAAAASRCSPSTPLPAGPQLWTPGQGRVILSLSCQNLYTQDPKSQATSPKPRVRQCVMVIWAPVQSELHTQPGLKFWLQLLGDSAK